MAGNLGENGNKNSSIYRKKLKCFWSKLCKVMYPCLVSLITQVFSFPFIIFTHALSGEAGSEEN